MEERFCYGETKKLTVISTEVEKSFILCQFLKVFPCADIPFLNKPDCNEKPQFFIGLVMESRAGKPKELLNFRFQNKI